MSEPLTSFLDRLTERPKTWLHRMRSTVDAQWSRRGHLVVQSSNGDGFVLVGGFGARHRFRTYYLPATASIRTQLKVHRQATADQCRQLADRYGLVVFCGDSVPEGLAPDLMTLPLSVDMEVPVPPILEGAGAPWSRSAKSNIARVKREGFTCDVMIGDAWVKSFHRNMFRPAMHSRHGLRALMETEHGLERLARAEGAELLRVLDNGEWVAGCISQSTPQGYRMAKLGWLRGDDELFKRGVVAAVYWYTFQRARALGRERMLVGNVEPHLDDGILLYKSHWGAGLCPESRSFGNFQLLLQPAHATCRRFLRAHSLITVGADGGYVVFSRGTPATVNVSPAVLSGIRRWYQWRDEPGSGDGATTAEVAPRLRPWLTLLPLTRSD